jgi:hypothetical protein
MDILNDIEKEFVPYKQALALKELGFDEPCLMYFDKDKQLMYCPHWFNNSSLIENKINISSPTFSQVFKWFRKKYFLFHSIDPLGYNMCLGLVGELGRLKSRNVPNYGTYEEAELECLKKLIELVKK